MKQNDNTGSARTFVLVVGLLAFAILIYALVRTSNSPESQYTEPKNTQEIERKEVRSSDIPSQIPSDLPFINQGVVLQNFTNTTATHLQSARRWVVDAKLEAVSDAYKNYFRNNKWNEVSNLQTGDLTIIGVAKDAVALSFSVIQQKETGKTIIEITANTAITTN